jgi:RNA polymerase sigma factor (sigma-70 family)
MPSATLARLVSRCRGLTSLAQAAPDAELLRRFTRSADPDAFAELLGRYAGLVWGVCRRTLPQEADAEDAFQATFLALARNAPSIDPRRPLGAWLHAVAVRVARRALGKTLRRRTTDLPDCVGPMDVVRDVSSRDLFQAVDEEIERLPEGLRGPVVLCCLEGRARDEAADALGCSVAAVKARLERARQALRQALARRGIALPAALFALGIGATRVGAALKERAVKAALGSPSPAVAALASAGTSTQFGLVGFALVTALVVGVGAFGLSGQPKDTPEKETPAAPNAAEPPPRADRFGDPLPDGALRRFGTLRFRHEATAAITFTPDGRRLVAGVGRSPLAVFDPVDGRKLREVGSTSANNNYGFALSPDGKRLYSTGYHLVAHALDTGAKVRTFDDAVRCSTVAVSPDGKKVAVAREHQNGVAMVLDADTGKTLVELKLKDVPASKWGPEVRGLAFSADGRVVAGIVIDIKETSPNVLMGVSLGLRFWEVATGNPLGTVGPADDAPNTFAFVPGTKVIACLGDKKTIHVWDSEAGKAVRTIPLGKGDEPAGDLVVSADGRRLAVCMNNGKVAVFDLKTGAEVRRVVSGDGFMGPIALALSPDGAVLACGKMYGDSSIRVWDVDSGKERLADVGHRGPAKLSLAADGKTLVSRGAGQVFRWDLATGRGTPEPDDEKDEDGYVRDGKWSRGTYRTAHLQYTLDHGSGIIEVRTRDGSKPLGRATCPPDFTRGAAHSADGKTFAVSFQDRGSTVLLWSPERHSEPFRLTGHPDAIQQMAFTRDGQYLIAGAGTHSQYATETLFVYNVGSGQLVSKLSSHSAPGHMLLMADDRTLITGGLWNDATVNVWNLRTDKEIATLVDPAVSVPILKNPAGGEVPSIGGMALSPDGRFLAVLTGSAGASSVSVWDTGSWKLVKAFPPAKPRCDAGSLAFARDGRSVFVAYLDSTILEWDVAGRSGPTPALTPGRLDELWQTLGHAEKGYAAAWELLDHPAEAVAFLRTKLAPATPADAAAVKELIRKLGSDVFREREEAGKKLIALGEAVLPIVREATKGESLAEVKERVDKVIAALTSGLTAEQLRQRRAVAVLEWSERADADELLRRLAGGDPVVQLTKDARAAIKRHGRKAGFSD